MESGLYSAPLSSVRSADSRYDSTPTLAVRAARMLEECCGNELTIEEIAFRLGCTDRHLRRAFLKEFGVSPVNYLQTCKLQLAKTLLADTNLPVVEISHAAGFGSLRRFNDLFKKHYSLAPTALRGQVRPEPGRDGNVTLSLPYRPPYRWDALFRFLVTRVISGVEAVHDNEYRRTVRLAQNDGKEFLGCIRVGDNSAAKALTVAVDSSLLPVLPRVLGRVRHMFDLACYPEQVHASLASMNAIRPGLSIPGTRIPGCFDPFEMAVRAVLAQQITVKGARTLAARLVERLGVPLETGIEGLTRVFPSSREIAMLGGRIGDRLGPLGIIGARARTILELARRHASGEIELTPCVEPEREIEKLLRIPGIGPWTAHYIAMRAMGWTDAFLDTDYGVKKALEPRAGKELLALAESWRPWRSYATVSLWNSLYSF